MMGPGWYLPCLFLCPHLGEGKRLSESSWGAGAGPWYDAIIPSVWGLLVYMKKPLSGLVSS